MEAIGSRRHNVTLDNPGPSVPDGEGGFIQARVELFPRHAWARIQPATARNLERVVANTVQSTATHIISMPFHPQVTTATRVTFGTRLFEVTGVQNPEERNIELVLACHEVVT